MVIAAARPDDEYFIASILFRTLMMGKVGRLVCLVFKTSALCFMIFRNVVEYIVCVCASDLNPLTLGEFFNNVTNRFQSIQQFAVIQFRKHGVIFIYFKTAKYTNNPC